MFPISISPFDTISTKNSHKDFYWTLKNCPKIILERIKFGKVVFEKQ